MVRVGCDCLSRRFRKVWEGLGRFGKVARLLAGCEAVAERGRRRVTSRWVELKCRRPEIICPARSGDGREMNMVRKRLENVKGGLFPSREQVRKRQYVVIYSIH